MLVPRFLQRKTRGVLLQEMSAVAAAAVAWMPGLTLDKGG